MTPVLTALLIPFSALSMTWIAATPEQGAAVREAMLTDYARAEAVIGQGELVSALPDSGRVLYVWRESGDFLDLLRKVEEAYASQTEQAIREGLQQRSQEILSGTAEGIMLLDAAILNRALGNLVGAEECLRKAVEDPLYVENPGVGVLLGRTLLDAGRLAEATPEYELAILLAEQLGDPSAVFAVRHASADDLYRHEQVNLGVRAASECLQSDYLMERAWALGVWIIYSHHIGNPTEALRAYTELSELLPGVTPSPASDWEQRRFGQTQTTLSWYRGVLEGDTLSRMILDVEAADPDFKSGNLIAVERRLRPWKDRFPLSAFDTIQGPTREWVVWVHYNYHAVNSILGRYTDAEAGFREMTERIPAEEFAGRVVDAWCWLGHVLRCQGRLEEAQAAFESGLALDQGGSDAEAEAVDFTRLRLREGKTSGSQRVSYVHEYQRLLEQLQAQ
ncbi:MAG: hypothetical protein GHCLOJNM_00181 [bacterium]|nr:hypothetical protein [bacterium]